MSLVGAAWAPSAAPKRTTSRNSSVQMPRQAQTTTHGCGRALPPLPPLPAPSCYLGLFRRRSEAFQVPTPLRHSCPPPCRLPAGWRQEQRLPARPQRCRLAWRAAAEPPSGSGSKSSRDASLEAAMYGGEEVPLSRLQAQLEAAVEDEDYELAAQLRDTLQ